MSKFQPSDDYIVMNDTVLEHVFNGDEAAMNATLDLVLTKAKALGGTDAYLAWTRDAAKLRFKDPSQTLCMLVGFELVRAEAAKVVSG